MKKSVDADFEWLKTVGCGKIKVGKEFIGINEFIRFVADLTATFENNNNRCKPKDLVASKILQFFLYNFWF